MMTMRSAQSLILNVEHEMDENELFSKIPVSLPNGITSSEITSWPEHVFILDNFQYNKPIGFCVLERGCFKMFAQGGMNKMVLKSLRSGLIELAASMMVQGKVKSIQSISVTPRSRIYTASANGDKKCL